MLITIRPGPTVCIWQGGKLVAEIPLTVRAALSLARDLLDATSRNT